ncbi:alpha/beta fold hydrolase [Cellulomonas marina]|uniref:Acyl-CoA synthetase (AMP-forming)/AMP-acid ligase II n=1 Tax=Cellulomonas marina TaxID=988821 RepID=A0A1I0XF36_9CELL|nr:alpha/beta fold hydrolase [Cellulomonas marina]GIG29864.1 acyl-CoA synthetase [Cellulomonas marina]SFA99632.1 Acyl-CoA synthetase (AMP-forming)/AMP-acid ligase II [Cellulomonas marina]
MSGPTPVDGLPGVDPRDSRVLDVPAAPGDRGGDGPGDAAGDAAGDATGETRRWHVLDTAARLAGLGVEPVGTLLAVHGNPTWSYLWRALLARTVADAAAGRPAWRVVAVDQLELGFSERTGRRRDLAQRLADLSALTDALGLSGPGATGPVVTVGHDWGGVVSLGWAVRHPEVLAGVVTLNTAVHHPLGDPLPAPLRLATARGVLASATRRTTAFLDVTLALARRPPLPDEVRAAYRAPYAGPAGGPHRRDGIAGFVADIPADATHPSRPALDEIADGVARLTVPALVLWGPRDPVFTERYLDDLVDRLPHARVHRYVGAGHLLAEEVPYADAVAAFVAEEVAPSVARPGPAGPSTADLAGRTDGGDAAGAAAPAGAPAPFVPLWRALDERADDDGPAVLDLSVRRRGAPLTVSWRRLAGTVRALAAGLDAAGVRRGQRVQLLVPPGPTLTALVYACLRLGAVVVVADAGLGVRGLSRAVRASWPDVLVAAEPGLLAARALGWPGRRVSAVGLPAAARAALGVETTVAGLVAVGRVRLAAGLPLPAEPGADDPAAVLHTSGSTGPAKGVRYTHGQLAAMRDVVRDHFGIGPRTGLVTGFAPFALLGPAFGTRSVTPVMDVSAPRTLTARAVADAVRAADGRVVFLSPAAIRNVVATAGELGEADREALGRVTTFLSTGAPIAEPLLAAAAALMPGAVPHTPYGMTECLLVTDVTLEGVRAAAGAPDGGVCVGVPIGPARVRIAPLDEGGRAVGAAATTPGVLGEVVVSAPHLKDGYDRLWLTDREAARDVSDAEGARVGAGPRWHRTGDVGHLDDEGRLWIEGRLAHVLTTAVGPVAPVAAETAAETVPGVRRAALVGVGPAGVQVPVVVVEPEAGSSLARSRTGPLRGRSPLAPAELVAAVRAAVGPDRAGVPVVAVLVADTLPTDVRHNSKVDRARLAAWAARVLAGDPVRRP